MHVHDLFSLNWKDQNDWVYYENYSERDTRRVLQAQAQDRHVTAGTIAGGTTIVSNPFGEYDPGYKEVTSETNNVNTWMYLKRVDSVARITRKFELVIPEAVVDALEYNGWALAVVSLAFTIDSYRNDTVMEGITFDLGGALVKPIVSNLLHRTFSDSRRFSYTAQYAITKLVKHVVKGHLQLSVFPLTDASVHVTGGTLSVTFLSWQADLTIRLISKLDSVEEDDGDWVVLPQHLAAPPIMSAPLTTGTTHV